MGPNNIYPLDMFEDSRLCPDAVPSMQRFEFVMNDYRAGRISYRTFTETMARLAFLINDAEIVFAESGTSYRLATAY